MALTQDQKIVTRRVGRPNSWTLQAYLDDGGYQGLRKALTMTPEEITQEVLTSNILGRGGAGFEAGKKWSMMRKAKPAYLVVNGDESEPATFKDHMLVENDPHQLVEGALICAFATGADKAFLYVRGEFALGIERVQQAVNEAYAYGAIGQNIFDSGWSIDVVVHM
ncbi:MAG: NADH-quinone oxidoreductase subunit F, partial [Actinobacteria bacterium]|nr:NADH-quinone oxidoreductase subunit F [Actinomycetota bacterium]